MLGRFSFFRIHFKSCIIWNTNSSQRDSQTTLMCDMSTYLYNKHIFRRVKSPPLISAFDYICLKSNAPPFTARWLECISNLRCISKLTAIVEVIGKHSLIYVVWALENQWFCIIMLFLLILEWLQKCICFKNTYISSRKDLLLCLTWHDFTPTVFWRFFE